MAKARQDGSDNDAAQRRVQMADIARLAGVSTATVSRALNHSPLVSEETRRRILELAASLKYSINIGAQNLRLKQNRTISVLIPFDRKIHQNLTDPFLLAMLGSLADALTEQGFDMLFSRIATDELGAAAAAPFDSGRVVGIILVGQWGRHQQLNELAARKVPIVVWGAQLPQQLYCCVGSDNVSGGMLATQHLLEQGRRRIAFFGDIELPEPAQRYRGYCAALEKHGIAVDPRLQVSTPFLPIGGSAAVETLEARAISYDAVFACSDLLAMTAIDSLRAHGKRVPDDVAVVGYDDIDQSAYFHPRLTTIRQPIGAAGRALVAALLALIDGTPAASVELPTQLIVRASAGEERAAPA
ncbi:LacI family DNA-binding transcriptional regulator [Pseudoduganella buxea]|uniref:LacI family DNA-binding transcriptional regulator n=1 Tax=Pseudoduganella buxea TaxID=1949069 RepID=A0A6I3SQZ0_9BURK|nr:LacI family DNA-binding transcriptional regulator [Pseudoduganella buxea]MTV51513.1 LacI family DNA-binding transcriptional regulator [Pseudoduganella buxea]GGB89586.1 LacI family transcriptional regulator [Pseudoduganella buxea]